MFKFFRRDKPSPPQKGLTIRPFSGCCGRGLMGKDALQKKTHPRGQYYGCMTCGQWIDRSEAAYELKAMRRLLRSVGYTRVRPVLVLLLLALSLSACSPGIRYRHDHWEPTGFKVQRPWAPLTKVRM